VDNNYNSNTGTVVKQDFAVVKQDWWVGGIHDWHNSAPELAEHHPWSIPGETNGWGVESMEQIRFFVCVGAGEGAIAHLSYNNY
jgi:hypothetical protein